MSWRKLPLCVLVIVRSDGAAGAREPKTWTLMSLTLSQPPLHSPVKFWPVLESQPLRAPVTGQGQESEPPREPQSLAEATG